MVSLLLLYFRFLVTVTTLPQYAVGWSAVCESGIS